MGKALSITLVVVAALMVTCFGGGYYLWKRYGSEMVAAGKAAFDDGKAYAVNVDNNACVTGAAERYPSDSGMAFAMKQSVFLQGCLPSSRKVEGFCDGVPASADAEASKAWMKGRCPNQVTGDNSCTLTSMPIQMFCHPSRPG
jgi:hypothetical protein